MIRKSLSVLLLFGCMSLYCQNSYIKEISELPFFQEADAMYKFEQKDISSYSLFFVPKFYVDGSGKFTGDFEEGFSIFDAVPSLSIIQNLPGNTKLKCSVGSYMAYSEENNFTYSLNPEITFSIPLVTTPAYMKLYYRYEKNNYGIRKRISDVKYMIAVKDGLSRFVSETGNYAFYKRLIKLFEEKRVLLEKQTEDYEKLFILGRISALELSDQINQKMKFLQEKIDVESKFITAKKNLMELGVDEENFSSDIKELVKKWNGYCSAYHDETFYRDEQQLISNEINLFSYIESANSMIPVFNAGFSVKTSDDLQSYPDFTESYWQLKFSFSIPVTEKFGLKPIDLIMKNEKMRSLEKAKILRSQKSSSEERKSYIKLYSLYKDSMKSAAVLEMNRLDSYKGLYSAGKLSEFDLMMQENTANLAELYSDYADLQLLTTKLSFY